jgi:GT2 family glycosyltransferase/glycosyltransferase involved in cell wall biosynthesis
MPAKLIGHGVSFLRSIRAVGLREAIAEKIRYVGRRSGLAGPEERAAFAAEIAGLREEVRRLERSIEWLGGCLAEQARSVSWLARNHTPAAMAAAAPGATPLVSVILPVWNRRSQVLDAVASVRAQTFRDWELLVVDDGSSDGTREALAPLLEEDPRIRLLAIEHRGAAFARNHGLAASRGAIVAYLDSDDVWFPTFLAAVVEGFRVHEDRDAAYGVLLVARGDDSPPFILGERFDRRSLRDGNFVPLPAFAHRRSLYERLGGFDEDLSRLNDWELVIRYTAERAPLELAVVAGESRVGPWRRISNEESYAFNDWKIRRKHPPEIAVRPRVLYALEYEPTLSESYIQAELACARHWGVEIEIWAENAAPAPCPTGVPVHRGRLRDVIERMRPHVVHVHHLHRGLRYLPDARAAGAAMTVRGHGVEFDRGLVDELAAAYGVERVYVFPHQATPFGQAQPKLRAMSVAFDADRYRPAPRKDPRLVVRASLAAPAKGLATFIRLAARFRSHRFVLFACKSIGYPDHLDELRELSRSLGDPVDLRVDRPYAEVEAVVGDAAVYLHSPTLEDPYGMPISIAEAMATGCWVIARRCPEAEAYVGDAGAFYETEDEAAGLIAQSASWPEEEWRNVRRRSVERAFGQFAADVVLRPLLDDWVRLAERPPLRHDPDGSRVWTASDGGGSRGLQVVPFPDGTIDGDGADDGGCLAFRNPQGAAQAYFRLARPHPFTGRSVDVEVEVFADVDDALRVEYDSTDLSVRVLPTLPGAFKPTPAVPLPAAADWRTVSFTIEDGRWTPSLNGCDFRIVSRRPQGLPLRLRRVEIGVRGESEDHGTASIRFDVPDRPAVSIIIPTWNHRVLVTECLRALAARTPPVCEVIVVDDGSSDGTAAHLAGIAGVRVVALATNGGFAKACNAGAREARAERLLFLNDDTVPLAGWLEPMLAALERDESIGAVGSRLLFPGASVIQHAGIELGDRAPRNRLRLFPADVEEAAVDRFVEAVTGACLLIRRALFENVGGFDEGFLNGCEDVDLCLRIQELGRRVLYCAASVLIHHESATRDMDDAAREVANLERLMRRWPGWRTRGVEPALAPA